MVVDIVIFHLNDWVYFFYIDAYDKEAVYCIENESLDIDDVVRPLINCRINSYQSYYFLKLDSWTRNLLEEMTNIEKLNWLKSQIG